MSSSSCRQCGRPLRASAPRGLCSACLLGAGLSALRPPSGPGTAPASAPVARRVGDYELLEEIARGGMGVVYKARQLGLDRIVALKLILGGQWAGREPVERFRAEAPAAGRLQHPNLVAIHDVGEQAGQLYYTMDYIEGRNLEEVVSNSRFEISNFARSARWMKTVAEAVQCAHQQGILHRDLKPANILIDQNDQPHITDFGLAKRFEVLPAGGPAGGSHGATSRPDVTPAEAGTARVPGPSTQADVSLSTLMLPMTLSGQVLGSPSYLSPEQAEGKRGTVGVGSDVYSLGAVLYCLLTGRPPFQGETLTALLRQVIETEPVAPLLERAGVGR